MIVVRVELHSAITGETTEIARMSICNKGDGTLKRGNYVGRSIAGRGAPMCGHDIAHRPKHIRQAEVLNYPRLTLHVWNLVARMLKSMKYDK